MATCTGKWFCGRWRTCIRCAAIRQARIADRAEYLEQRHGKLAFARATPNDKTVRQLRAIRNNIIRQKLAPAGLWTVEAGELYGALHLNLLLPAASFFDVRPHVDYIELVHTSARAAAAYIADREGFPDETQYQGRLFGEWGSLTQHLMASKDGAVAVGQAAALELALARDKGIANYYLTDAQFVEKIQGDMTPRPERTRSEYAEIARRNLSNIYATLAAKR